MYVPCMVHQSIFVKSPVSIDTIAYLTKLDILDAITSNNSIVLRAMAISGLNCVPLYLCVASLEFPSSGSLSDQMENVKKHYRYTSLAGLNLTDSDT